MSCNRGERRPIPTPASNLHPNELKGLLSIRRFEIEAKLLGCDHAEVGGRLLERWKLPEHLVAAVRYHHQPAAATPHERLTACVTLGNFMAYFMGQGYGHHSLSLTGRDQAMTILKLSPERLPRFMDEAFEKVKAVRSLYGMAS